ncbi:MAG: ABC transporter substrate-binding protein [Thermoguttaceae bacterium]
MRTTTLAPATLFCIALSMVLVLMSTGCRQEAQLEVQSVPLPITLACQPAPYSGLIAVADEKGFFKKAGIEVTLNLYPSGSESLQAMMRGEARVATAADIAFASKMEADPSLRVLASIGASTGSQIVARKDRSIHEPAGLKGKRIGYSPDTVSAYFLDSFLLTNHILRSDVTLVAIPPARQVEAIVSGEVDAVSAFDVYAYVAKKKLGGNAAAWDSQNTLDYQWLLVTKESETQAPEAVKRLLKALILAEEFAIDHADETRSIISRKWKIDPEYVDHSWSQTRLFVSLNQSIITALQSYVKWKMDSEGTTGDPPDIVSYVQTGPLEAVDPRLVTLFR